MKDKLKYIITVVLSAAIIFGFSAWFLLKAPTEYSDSERRALKLLPDFSIENVLSGKYMSEFEDASPDQFPLRDLFRSIKAYASEYLFFRMDNNKIFQAQGHLSKLEYPMKDDMIDYANDVKSKLEMAGIRVEVDSANEKIGYKIRNTKLEKVPYFAVIGAKEKETGILAIKNRQDIEFNLTVEELIEKIQKECKEAVNVK